MTLTKLVEMRFKFIKDNEKLPNYLHINYKDFEDLACSLEIIYNERNLKERLNNRLNVIINQILGETYFV